MYIIDQLRAWVTCRLKNKLRSRTNPVIHLLDNCHTLVFLWSESIHDTIGHINIQYFYHSNFNILPKNYVALFQSEIPTILLIFSDIFWGSHMYNKENLKKPETTLRKIKFNRWV